jgi:hypothetical protein
VKFSVRPSIFLNNRECSPLGVNEGVNFTPKTQISPLGARGEVKNGPLGTSQFGGAKNATVRALGIRRSELYAQGAN